MDALLHKIGNSENSKSYDEILTIANEVLQILITDASDLLKIIELKTYLSSKNHESDEIHRNRQTNYEIKQKLIKSTNCNNDLTVSEEQSNCEFGQKLIKLADCKKDATSKQDDMITKEKQMISEIKSENLERDIKCKHETRTQQSYLKFVAQIFYIINRNDSYENNECIINLNLEQQKFNCIEAQINCKINIEDFPRIFENNSSQSFIEQDLTCLEGQVKSEIDPAELLRIIELINDLTYKQPDFNLNEQIDCEFNVEGVTKCNFDLGSQQPLMNIKGGQIHCVINLEDLLKVAQSKCDLGSDKPNLIVIEGQIDCEMKQKDLPGATECKIDLVIDQPGLNVTGQINCDVNLEDFLRYTECKTSASE